MWKNLSVSRWIFLLTFIVVMVVSASEAAHFLQLGCCAKVDRKISRPIKGECFEQKKRGFCIHAFVVRVSRTKWQCIDPNDQWINKRIKKGTLKCSPLVRKNGFET